MIHFRPSMMAIFCAHERKLPVGALTSVNFADEMRRTGDERRWLSGLRYAFFRRGGVRRMRKVRLADLRWIECGLDRVVDALKPDETNPVAGVFGYVLDVLAVARRKHDGGDPGLDRRQHLFLHASDRKHQSAQRDFAGHGSIAADRASSQKRGQRQEHRNSRTRTVLGDGPGRNMNMGVGLL